MKLVAREIQRWWSMRVLVWPGLRPLSRNPQGAVVDEVEFGSGGLTSIMLAEVGKALARVSFRVLHVVQATSGSYLKSSGSTRIAFGVASHWWSLSGSILSRTWEGQMPWALKLDRGSPKSLKLRCAFPLSGCMGVMACRWAKF